MIDLLGDDSRPLTRHSPLPYPGGKSKAKHIIRQIFPRSLTTLVSPFLGGGSIELDCAADGIKVYAGDVYEDLVNFWVQLQTDPEQVATHAGGYIPITSDKFQSILDEYPNVTDVYKRAALFWLVHKCTWGKFGFSIKNGYTDQHSQHDDTQVKKYLKGFYNPNIEVRNIDFEESLKLDEFAYLDPPYLIESSNLYGKDGNTHKGFDHDRLCRVLRGRDRWVLSYNDCEQIRDLYTGYTFYTPNWYWGLHHKPSNEVLITNV